MLTKMASLNLLVLPYLLPLLAALFVTSFAFDESSLFPFNCSAQINACKASLYHINHNLKVEDLATFYSVVSSQITPIKREIKQDYLITAPCSCKNSSDLKGYFYNTSYAVQPNDTFANISDQIYSGQPWPVERELVSGEKLAVNIVCGCATSGFGMIVTYTLQQDDTLYEIANLLSANLSEIVTLNRVLAPNPEQINVGLVLFVPLNISGIFQYRPN